jgi:hypothetical protein
MSSAQLVGGDPAPIPPDNTQYTVVVLYVLAIIYICLFVLATLR